MSSSKPIVAIVGRPNVGKSSLFNRVIKQKKSIVDDQPGVTRDRIYSDASWLTRDFILIDTGGLQIKDAPFQVEIKAQAQIAMDEANIIVFLTDYYQGLTEDDKFVAKLLRKTKKPIIIAANKFDKNQSLDNSYEFMTLGYGEPIRLSCEHGLGIGDLLDKIVDSFPKVTTKEKTVDIRFSILGRTNVGKSSLLNTILNSERSIVSDIEHTTRDSINAIFTRNKSKYEIIDTAGIRRKSKMFDQVERYALLRTIKAIDESDVALLVLDGSQEFTSQDEQIYSYIQKSNKATIIVVNKWDKVVKDEHTMNVMIEKIRKTFRYLDFAPIEFISALEHKRIDKLFDKINIVYKNLNHRVNTSLLNEIISQAQILHNAPLVRNNQLKIYYSTQAEGVPPVFVLFVNDSKLIYFSYTRYLENQIRDQFGFEGVPVKFIFRNKKD